MARNIVPDQDNINLDIGRFIHETSFRRKRKEISIGNVKVDLIDKKRRIFDDWRNKKRLQNL